MSEKKLYTTLEIPGSFLVPGFCIYVLEIVKEKQKWFYIGMTGDSHYPSARTAFHRISGHLELNPRSTQNQLGVAIETKLKILSNLDLEKISIKMYHFPIKGFEKITKSKLDKAFVQEYKKTEDYTKYKAIQEQVLSLENALIFELKDKLLNKTKGKKIKLEMISYPEIYNSIIELVNNG